MIQKRTYNSAPTKEQALGVMSMIQARCALCPECETMWNWTGNHQDRMHHAVVERAGVRIGVRHAVWAAYRGDKPTGTVLSTKCDNPTCLNPELATAMTRADVIARGTQQGKLHNSAHNAAKTVARRARGAKLSMEIAREVRQNHGVSCLEYSKRLGVTPQVVSQIRRGQIYRDATPWAGLGARA